MLSQAATLISLISLFKTMDAIYLNAIKIDLGGTPPNLTGPLAPNNILTKAERFKHLHVRGPDSFAYHNGHIYTGLADGRIVDISDCATKIVTRIGGNNCIGTKCGRPMGMRIDNNGRLIVADAVKGLIRVEPQTGRQTVLYSATSLVNRRPSRFINDLAVAKDGTVLFSDSSSKWTHKFYMWSIVEGESTGRLLAYNPTLKKTIVIADKLSFPSGVELAPDESFLLYAEASRARIMKLHLTKGAKLLTKEPFATNLPGLPSGIRASGRGTYWVSMYQARHENVSSLLDEYKDKPRERGMVGMITTHQHFVSISSKYGMVVELDSNGNIIRSLQDPSGKRVTSVTSVMEREGSLYLGSYDKTYVSRVALTRALNVERFISKLKTTCRARKANIDKMRRLLKRIVAFAEFRRTLLRAKAAREALERQRLASTTTTPVPPTQSTTTASSADDSANTTASTLNATDATVNTTDSSMDNETFTSSNTTEAPDTNVTSTASTADPSSVSTDTTTTTSAPTTTFNDDEIVPTQSTSTAAPSTISTSETTTTAEGGTTGATQSTSTSGSDSTTTSASTTGVQPPS